MAQVAGPPVLHYAARRLWQCGAVSGIDALDRTGGVWESLTIDQVVDGISLFYLVLAVACAMVLLRAHAGHALH